MLGLHVRDKSPQSGGYIIKCCQRRCLAEGGKSRRRTPRSRVVSVNHYVQVTEDHFKLVTQIPGQKRHETSGIEKDGVRARNCVCQASSVRHITKRHNPLRDAGG